MLTSKEIIEKTGLSRATLNNYIASGLVARPQVLPPGPEHGAAPRIGYFPDDTLTRIETIQRLKREGWSITRIAAHFAGRPASAASPATPATQQPARMAAPPAPAPLAATAGPAPADRNLIATGLALTAADVSHPAYLVNEGFGLVWMNEPARSSVLSPLAQRTASGGVVQHLRPGDQAAGNVVVESGTRDAGPLDDLLAGEQDVPYLDCLTQL